MSNVIPHPNSTFDTKIENADKSSGLELTRLFCEAVDGGLSRKRLLEAFKGTRKTIEFSYYSYESLVIWCQGKSFQPNTKVDTPNDLATRETTQIHHHDFAELAKTLFDETHKLAQALSEIASTHRYGFFPPGWEVDSAEWVASFDEDDPCVVIGKYIPKFFGADVVGPYTDPNRPHVLYEVDREILDIIISGCARQLHKTRPASELDARTARRLLNAACSAWCWGNTIDCYSADFFSYLGVVPDPVARALIRFWIDEDPSWYLRRVDADKKNILEQVRFFRVMVAKNLFERGVVNSWFELTDHISDIEIEELPILDFSVKEILSLLDCCSTTESELSLPWGEREWSSEVASEAVYNARDRIFGGAFPFSMSSAFSYIGELVGKPHFWLARLSMYRPETYAYSAKDDPFRVFDRWFGWDFASASKVGRQIDPMSHDQSRSSLRFEAFVSSFKAMQRDRLDELSKAWWAFFIASQAMAFEAMGLSPTQIGELHDITTSLLPDEMIAKSLRFALRSRNGDKETVSARVFKVAVQDMLDRFGETERVVDFKSDRPMEHFFQRRLGSDIWKSLYPESRRDLMDAEILWDQAHSELGAGRADWGGIVTYYSRVIESELRLSIADVIDDLVKVGIVIQERTLGGCLFALRKANDRIRKDDASFLSDEQKAKVQRLHRFFADQASFIKEQRDRAAHGNRENLIGADDFLRWRNAIYDLGALRKIKGEI